MNNYRQKLNNFEQLINSNSFSNVQLLEKLSLELKLIVANFPSLDPLSTQIEQEELIFASKENC